MKSIIPFIPCIIPFINWIIITFDSFWFSAILSIEDSEESSL